MNLVPKDGGNRFSGGVKYAKSPADWQGDNLTDELQAPTASARSTRSTNFCEFNVEQGGPILQDKLWFFGAYRQARYDKPIANTFDLPTGVPAPRGVRAVPRPTSAAASRASRPRRWTTRSSASPGRCRSATSSRSTYDRAMRLRGRGDEQRHRPAHRLGRVEHADLRHRLGQVDLDGLVEPAARGRLLVQPRALRQPLPGRHPRRARHAGVVPQRAQERHSAPASCGTRRRRSSATIPTATPRCVGALVRHRLAHRQGRRPSTAGASTAATTTPTPTSTRPTPTACRSQVDGAQHAARGRRRTWTASSRLYAQDSWRFRNFTFNFGLRYDRVAQSIVGQEAQIGRFANVPAYDDFEVPTWSDFSPRTSVVWDIFGNGKTADPRRLQQVHDRRRPPGSRSSTTRPR